jgi:hypothetical protein
MFRCFIRLGLWVYFANIGFGQSLTEFKHGSLVVGTHLEQVSQSGSKTLPPTVQSELGVLIQQSEIVKTYLISEQDRMAVSVAISGDTLIVGAPGVDSGGESGTNPPVQNAGAVYIFRHSNESWKQEAILFASNPGTSDFFGGDVAIDGDTVVVGAYGEDSGATDVDGDQFDDESSSSGAAYIFRRSGSTWNQEAYLKANNNSRSSRFGISVDVSGDTVAVGANWEAILPPEGINAGFSGAAYIFERTESVWHQQTYLKASNIGRDDEFGTAVAINGDILVVGSPNEDSDATEINGDENNDFSRDSGAAYVFIRSGSAWNQETYLKPSIRRFEGFFGTSLAIKGNRVLIGAPGRTGPGAAYVFIRNDSVWTEEARITAAVQGNRDRFGSSVAITEHSAVIGAPDEDSLTRIINGDPYNNDTNTSGAAYLFSRTGSEWAQQAFIKSSDSQRLGRFGFSVAIGPNHVICGAPTFGQPSSSDPSEQLVGSGKVYAFQTTIDPRTVSNTITFDPIEDQTSDVSSINVSATASSGLPVRLSVISGPAILSGNTLSLTGGIDQVIIRAKQDGNAIYPPAQSVSQEFRVIRKPHLTYFGESSEGYLFAAIIEEGNSKGYLMGSVGGAQNFFLLKFDVSSDGGISAHSLKNLAPLDDTTTSAFQFSGTLTADRINFRIAEQGVTFEAPNYAIPPNITTSGLYIADLVAPSSGKAYFIVASLENIYCVVVGSNFVTSAFGASEKTNGFNTFKINTADGGSAGAWLNSRATKITGTVTRPDGTEHSIEGLSIFSSKTDRTTNLSTRAFVDSASGINLITGFVIAGTESKRVLLRAVGPSLRNYGVEDALTDPRLTLYDSSGNTIAEVDDWGGKPEIADAMAHTGAFELDTQSSDSAYLTDLAPGVYTMSIQNDTAPGIVLAEIYDASLNPTSQVQRLINISSRGRVIGGEGVLTGGFSITGNSPKRVLIRGVGPTLSNFGVTDALGNPTLKVFDSDRQVVAQNNDWHSPDSEVPDQQLSTAAEITRANSVTGAFQLDNLSTDSAIIATLSPGTYTVQLDSADGSPGTALIEVYEIDGSQN